MSILRQHARSVVFRQLPPSLEIKQVISSLPSGSIHNIIPKPNESLVIDFLDSNTASRFTRNFLSLPRAPPIKDVSIEYGSTKPLPVEILAEIGLRGASRVVRVSSNNGKDIPNGLEDELKKIGSIESFEINPDGRSAAVHFMSIDEAVEALRFLRASKSYGGYSVYFGIDRKSNHPRFSKNAPTDLVLTGLPKGTTSSELVRRIQSGLPNLNREIIRSMVFDEESQKAIINFLEPAPAKIVFDSFNAAKTSTGGVSVSWSPTPSSPVNLSLRIAVSAGVSRTLSVSNLQNVRQLRHILKASEEFGTLISHPYDPSKKTVNIEFADIYSALKAIVRLRDNMPAYPAFSNACVSFATSNASPMTIITTTGAATPKYSSTSKTETSNAKVTAAVLEEKVEVTPA